MIPNKDKKKKRHKFYPNADTETNISQTLTHTHKPSNTSTPMIKK